MDITLLVMAAGLGSRYGGDKQVDGLGPAGETLMEYSVYDAIRADFHKVVFIVRPEMKGTVEALCGKRIAQSRSSDGAPVSVSYALQDFSSLPAWYSLPSARSKPFGTAHAVLCARDVIHEPFAVINADDYYGAEAFQTAAQALRALPARGAATMVSYRLDQTVSKNGPVTRGICQTTGGRLTKIVETFRIHCLANEEIQDGDHTPIPPETPVSMNFWGFTPWIFEKLADYFTDFLKKLPPDAMTDECLLPALVGELVEQGQLDVSVLTSNARWFGVTYREDRDTVRKELKRLRETGAYPKILFPSE